jgi:hypothetical protein
MSVRAARGGERGRMARSSWNPGNIELQVQAMQ